MALKRKMGYAKTLNQQRLPQTTAFLQAITGKRQKTTFPRNISNTFSKAPALSLRSAIAEKKSMDFPVAASSPQTQAISTTATFDVVNLPQEGASFYNRIGRKIMMRSLHLCGQIVRSAAVAGTVSEYLRVMVVYDRQPNKAAPAIADLLLNYDNAGGTVTNSLSSLNMNNAERFAILRDIRIHIPQEGNVAATQQTGIQSIIDYQTNRTNINEYIKLKDLETHFASSTNPSAIGDCTTGALWVVTFGNLAAGTANYQLNYTTRLRYHDI